MAIIGHDWAKEILRKLNINTKYQELYSEIASAIQFKEEEEEENRSKKEDGKDATLN